VIEDVEQKRLPWPAVGEMKPEPAHGATDLEQSKATTEEQEEGGAEAERPPPRKWSYRR
jgi:hypothetical protein